MDFLELMQSRYTTKHYDRNRMVSEEVLQKILECYRLTPTAVNIQSTVLFVIKTPGARAKLRRAISESNMNRYDTVPVVLMLCSRDQITEAHFDAVISAEKADGRFTDPQVLTERRQAVAGYVARRTREIESTRTWTGKQAYLAFETILLAAAAYGVDATPVEGYDPAVADAEFALKDQGLHSEALVFLGYRDPGDTNDPVRRPKSRLPFSYVVKDL